MKYSISDLLCLKISSLLSVGILLGNLVLGQSGLPDGPGAELAAGKCLPCHDLNVILDSAGIRPQLWSRILDDMEALGMNISVHERESLLRYLTTSLSPEGPAEFNASNSVNTPDPGDGAKIYEKSCQICHGVDGSGSSQAGHPPLAGNDLLAKAPEYAIATVLFGLQGKIQSQGKTFDGIMPPQPGLGDKAIASVINHVLSAWGNNRFLADHFKRIAPESVSKLRQNPKKLKEVLQMRPKE